jgi:PST family polysaccharide transporter
VVVIAVLARLLTPRDFGLVSAAGVVIWLSGIFSNFGVAPALVQRERLEQRHIQTGFASSLIFGFLFAGLLYLLAPSISVFFRMEGLTPVLRALVLVFPVGALGLVAESLLQRELRFGTIAGAELVSYVVGYGGIGIALAVAGFGVWALVAAEIAKSVIKSVLYLLSVPHPKRMRFEPRAFGELLRFGSGYTAGSLSTYFALQGDNLVIGRFLGAASLGLYGRAYELMVVPANALGAVLAKILFPTFAKLQGEPQRMQVGYRRGLALVALTVLPIAVATIVLAPEIILVLLGPRWLGAVLPLRILGIGMYFRVAYMVGQAVANSAGAVYRAAWRSAVYAALVVAGSLIGQHWGLPGVAAGVVLAVSANFAMVSQLNHRITGLPWRALLAVHLPALSLAVLLGAEVWLVATLLRSHGAAAAIILAAVAAIALFTALLLLRLFPRRLMGEDGIWIIRTVAEHAPQPVQLLLRSFVAADV